MYTAATAELLFEGSNFGVGGVIMKMFGNYFKADGERFALAVRSVVVLLVRCKTAFQARPMFV